MPSDQIIIDSSNAAGCIFNEDSSSSCVLIGKKWALGIAHNEMKPSQYIQRQLSFDIVENGISPVLRKTYSLNPTWPSSEKIKIWQFFTGFEICIFQINKNIEGMLPSCAGIKIPEGEIFFKKDDPIFSIGYPEDTWFREISHGKIIRIDENKIHAYAEFEKIQPGYSGGPIFSEEGKLLGIITTDLSDDDNQNIAKFTRLSAIVCKFKELNFPINETPTLQI